MQPSAFIPVLTLAACASAAPAPMPLAASGPTEVMVQGAAFMADLQPVPGGAQIGVTRQTAALGHDEGMMAKTVAQAFCAARGQSLDRLALGAFSGGLWVFDGGCV